MDVILDPDLVKLWLLGVHKRKQMNKMQNNYIAI